VSIGGMPERDEPHRGQLPIADRPYPGSVLYDAKDPDAKFPPIRPLRPPAGAPNVLVILLDDVGFGASSAFGGPVHTPTAERLAGEGLKYTRFHTTALCSPTRAALIGGRNHHTVGMGAITEFATSAPGYSSIRPNTCSPLPEILKLNGYATAHIGKCHEVPVWETSPAGPFDRWPTPGNGFEYFYGFFGGETDQWYPSLHEGITRVEPWGTPEEGYHLTPDLTDKAIAWISQQKALVPDKPFFMYFATGATHAPHHVPKEWADKYKGTFDDGWDALRERTFARQKELGVIPPDAELTPRHEEIPAWEDMPEELKPVLRRQMENYAGFLEHTDHHVGLLIDALAEQGLLDDTLVYYIVGDNGASAEGSPQGTFNELITLSNLGSELETPAYFNERLDKIGGPESMPHYAVGWAHAMCTPYQWTKQIASHWGGTRNGTIVHWPNGIKAKGELRHQFTHVIDVAPTVLEATGIPEPTTVNGITQKPMDGTSMLYSFDDAAAPERHETQYFEMMCNRGVYHRGWSAVTKHRTPWVTTGQVGVGFDDDVWELYDGSTDWTQANDRSKEHPDRLHELQRLFIIEATRHNVLPLDDRAFERVLPDVSGRPTLVGDKQTLLPGMGGLLEQHVVNWRNRSWSLTAQLDIPDGGADGVILSLGGHQGGWSLYLKDGRPAFAYNLFGIDWTHVRAEQPVAAGEHQVRIEFAYDGGGIGKGGEITLYEDGEQIAAGRVERTEPIGFGYEYTDVGRDAQSPVTHDYAEGDNTFTGTIKWVEMEAGQDSHDHLVDPGQVFHYHMAKQ
jgi:arylsulfatase A-like enzyme